ncbi:hypothetical protein OHU25_07240 [Streptomyces sp. NBC_00117]|uniref:hypothetical protein n=1 Tax=unclassified Streptomyces TaxID=2593676 RepID=UPI002E269D7B|nr:MULTISPECIES: hypothetical protein [unclassified Streptomyces]
MSNTDPMAGPSHPYDQYQQPPQSPRRPERREGGARRAGLVIHTIADIAAVFLGLWILLYLLEANQDNVFVGFVHGTADWLAGWSQDVFTMDTEGLRVLLNYGLPAVIYLLVGHGIAARLNRV